MNKGFRRILIFLIFSTGVIHTSCIEFNNDWEHSPQRNTFFLNPSRNEYVPLSPTHRSNLRETNRHPQSFRSSAPPSTDRFTKNNRDPSGRSALGYASVTREVYAHPLKPVTRSENAGLTPSSTRIATKRPTSFNIPLRKSIRVSSPVANRHQPIQTTGYIKESAVVKIPYHGSTQNPKHTAFVDSNLKQSSAQTEHDVTSFDDNWRPKRLPTVQPSYKTTTFVRPSKPIPFTRFSDAMAAIEHRIKVGDKRARPNLPSLSPSSNDNTRSETNSARRNTGRENKENVRTNVGDLRAKLPNINNEKLDTLILQSKNGPNRLAADSRKINAPVLINQYRDNFKDSMKSTTTDKVTFGVEYADSEIDHHLANVNENSSKQRNRNKNSGQTSSKSSEFQSGYPVQNKAKKESFKDDDIGSAKSSDIDVSSNVGPSKIIDTSQEYVLNSKNIANHKEFKNENRYSSEEVETLTPNKSKDVSATKSGSYVRYDEHTSLNEDKSDKETKSRYMDEEPHSSIETNKNKKLSDGSVPSKANKVDIPNFENPIVRSDSYNRVKDFEIPQVENFPKTPFYGEVIHQPYNQDYPKDITEDRIYFPQIFPDSNIGIQNHRNDSDRTSTKHSSVHITKNNYIDKERLIEINPKETNTNKNRDQNHINPPTYFNQPKAVTISDYSSLRSHSPTSPSLVTVDSDILDQRRPLDVILDPKRTKNAKNKTSNYVLHRTPVLSPEMPGYSHPRKPNIRLTPGMLAGILIAALIFLGFLTGTMVFVFHQIRFGSPPKKSERHKKRTTVYAPEYMDETFSGNTYIHNNIFLPNTQNLEDRLSPDMDTTFSVDSEETAQVNDHHYPSTSANTRVKTTMQQRIHDGDATN